MAWAIFTTHAPASSCASRPPPPSPAPAAGDAGASTSSCSGSMRRYSPMSVTCWLGSALKVGRSASASWATRPHNGSRPYPSRACRTGERMTSSTKVSTAEMNARAPEVARGSSEAWDAVSCGILCSSPATRVSSSRLSTGASPCWEASLPWTLRRAVRHWASTRSTCCSTSLATATSPKATPMSSPTAIWASPPGDGTSSAASAAPPG
mmetsp:Transcript_32909/g.92164  ORF Transcript_32909/g.92164 Transcript_32909/m.92164 type:complete len:209 (+) Transcript_32909:196-822(+)